MVLSQLRSQLRPRTRFREFAELRRADLRARRYAKQRTQPIVPGTVLYEAFFGNGLLDNPEAIFRYLLEQPDQSHLEHIWVLDDLQSHPEVTAEFAGHPRVRFVAYDSDDYLRALATSSYLINNSTFPQEFAKRPGQVYVNTWHGVPLKHMGFDMPEGGVESRNITRNFLHADYLLSANPFMTEVMYRKAYRLQGIFRGAVIEEGQPRTDRQRQALRDPATAVAELERRGVRVDGRRVVLYAPTWRGEVFQDPHVNAGELVSTVRKLQKRLGDEYVVLLKTHQVVFSAVKARLGDVDFLVPNGIPTNTVLGVADALVTDYSSIFFDYLPTGRPVVHYVPDLEDYRSGRGLYLAEEDLPGPITQTPAELADAVLAGCGGGASARSEAGAAVYNAKEDGSVCERLVDIVFRGKDETDYTVLRDFGTEKERLLIYLGGMKSNGIMTSALNLLHNIDYDRYDVTAFWFFSRGRDRMKNALLVDDRVRVIPRAPLFIASPRRVRRETRRLMITGLGDSVTPEHKQFWGEEWTRMVGAAEFDHLIDFSGYGCFAPFLFLAADKGKRSIWLHNDMMADMQRETIGEKHLEDRLQAVFSTYRHFDHLVSVSAELNRINREGLAAYAPPERFVSAVNTIDGDRVLRMAGRHEDSAPGGRPALATFDTRNVAAAVATLMEHFKAGDIIREARSRERISTVGQTKETKTFVTVGRLSPEKNHERLIRAFAQVHSKHPDIRLIILGGGALEARLQQLAANLGMDPFVSLAGQVDNPFAILADADCFIMSSDYEGQPMVILEARTLGLPVVTTAFSSVGDSVPADAGVVVPQTVEGVADGMQQFLAGKVPSHVLDTAAYNREAMRQFYAALDAPSS